MILFIRNIASILMGVLLGGLVNMALVLLGPILIPMPYGASAGSMEELAATIHLFEPQNFVFPWLAHALGTLVGAFFAAKSGTSHNMLLAWFVGFIFLIGGVYTAMQLNGPMWFNAIDLIFAYIPMALIGAKLAEPKRRYKSRLSV